jgi:uncharacterized protein (TIGR02452 family)
MISAIRAKNAVKQTKEYEEKYKKEINYSINNTILYDKNHPYGSCVLSSGLCEVNFDNTDTVSALFKVDNGKTAILNFASFKNPGGGFIRGTMAQEEALCTESFLYNVLKTQTDYYDFNKKHINNSMYLNRALYSKDILFFKNGEKKYADVLTCACPNKSATSLNNTVNSKVLQDRIHFLLSIFACNEINTIILGAFGCGVFKQDPKEVSTIFYGEILKIFDGKEINIIFAIPPGNDNYDNFVKSFHKE